MQVLTTEAQLASRGDQWLVLTQICRGNSTSCQVILPSETFSATALTRAKGTLSPHSTNFSLWLLPAGEGGTE